MIMVIITARSDETPPRAISRFQLAPPVQEALDLWNWFLQPPLPDGLVSLAENKIAEPSCNRRWLLGQSYVATGSETDC